MSRERCCLESNERMQETTRAIFFLIRPVLLVLFVSLWLAPPETPSRSARQCQRLDRRRAGTQRPRALRWLPLGFPSDALTVSRIL
jgi:hypothetical protein